jgi:phytanoyl-CoA hydroxylase
MTTATSFTTPKEVLQYQKDGFVLGGELISKDEVTILQQEVLRVLADRDDSSKPQPLWLSNLGDEDSPVWQIVDIWKASEAFRKVVTDSRLGEAVAEMMGADEVRLWHDQIQYKPAQVGGVNNWHQDAPYWPCLSQGDAMTVWLALDDADEDNGCMRMVPGSQAWGNTIKFVHSEMGDFYNPATEYQGKPLEVRSARVPAGSVHYHHSFTYHGSGNNTCGRPRRALAMHFITEKTTYVEKGGHPCEPLIETPLGSKVEGKDLPLVFKR